MKYYDKIADGYDELHGKEQEKIVEDLYLRVLKSIEKPNKTKKY